MRNCDIIMKGGITSGVVYPLVIVELSEEFRFRNIGGTSAGAIAAAVTAAAEYRRVTTKGSREGFDRLKVLPEFLAGTTAGEPNLLNLFPPTRSTRRLFAVATTFLGNGSLAAKSARAFVRLLALSPLLTVLSFAPVIALLIVLAARRVPFSASFAGLIAVEILLLLLGALLLVIFSTGRALFTTIPRNRFGFSVGRAPSDRTRPGVTDWLHREIQEIAGRRTSDPPLTFADLWLAGQTAEDRETVLAEAERNPDRRAINLLMMTTALTHGHPYRLPFENRRFSFRGTEFREYFPTEVVDHLIAKSRKGGAEAGPETGDIHALPEPWDLPIVVAARMSLSFPILFSMVPLYAVDFTMKKNRLAPEHERCWFIDGGLSSNFPMTLFDSPFPRWPAFGINLNEFHPDYPKDPAREENNVWMVEGSGAGTSDHWTRFPDRGTAAFRGYLGAMLDAMRNWHDNTQLAVPGFRDLIAHVKLTPDEGGLNLSMSAEKVRSLSERGRWAARRLRERFGAAGAQRDPLNWNSHRWTRYKTSMALLQKTLQRMHGAFTDTDPDYPDYNALLSRTSDANPRTGYWWNGESERYRRLTARFLDLARETTMSTADFDAESPNPAPELRVTPRL